MCIGQQRGSAGSQPKTLPVPGGLSDDDEDEEDEEDDDDDDDDDDDEHSKIDGQVFQKCCHIFNVLSSLLTRR